MPRNSCKDATNELAKMHFSINLEKAKKNDLEKLIEEKELREAKIRKEEAEDERRRSDLGQATNFNTKMQATLRNKAIMDRKTNLLEKDNVQTSLKSKNIETVQENFKFAQRRQRLVDTTDQNLDN